MSEAVAISEDALKLMVAENGVRATARMLGMDKTQTDAFRKRVERGKWLSDPAIATLRAAQPKVEPPCTVARPLVASVSPQQAMASELMSLGLKSRISLARGMAKAATTVENMDGQAILADANNVKAVAQTAAIVHGWAANAPQPKIRLELVNMREQEPITIEAESEVMSTGSWDSELDEY